MYWGRPYYRALAGVLPSPDGDDMSKNKKSKMSKMSKMNSSRRKAEIQMVNAVGSQLNQMMSTICNAAVESRRVDMEGLESSDKAAVLQSEGTTLVALVQSNNEAISQMWESMGPMAAAFLGQMAQTEATRAEACAVSAQAELLNAQSRAREAKNSEFNAETERIKANALRERVGLEREARDEARDEARYAI